MGVQDYQAVAKMGRSTFQQVVTDWPGINTRPGQSALHSETREGHGKVAGCQRGVVGGCSDYERMGRERRMGEPSSLHFSLRARRHLQNKFLSAVHIPACRLNFFFSLRGEKD